MTFPAFAGRLTPAGRGAVASIAFEGSPELLQPWFRARNGRSPAEQELQRLVYGEWGPAPTEDVVVCRLSEQQWEIHCHGGDAAVNRILQNLATQDVRISRENERPGWPTASSSPLSQDVMEAICQASTLRTAGILLEQPAAWRKAIDDVLSAFPDDVSAGNATALTSRKSEDVRRSLQTALRDWQKWQRIGEHLVTPWRVVLCGPPNVGKSSLINALVGYQRSVVYDQPGTTRDIVSAETAFDGWPVRLFDTAGLRDSDDLLETAGVARARALLTQADCLVVVGTASGDVRAETRSLRQQFPEALVIANKSDLVENTCADSDSHDDQTVLAVSALTGTGIEELSRAILEKLVPVQPPAGQALPFSRLQRELLAELSTECADRETSLAEICTRLQLLVPGSC